MRRTFWLLLLLLPCCIGFSASPKTGGPLPASVETDYKLIFCRSNVLYSVPITPSGNLLPGRKVRRIAHLPQRTELDSISVSADGSLIVIGVRQKGGFQSSLWMEADQVGGRLKRLGGGTSPMFAPIGKLLAYTASGEADAGESIYILDLITGKKRTLRDHAHTPCWSANGKEIALIDESKNDETRMVMVVDAATGKQIHFRREMINVHTPLLSPNGRYLAYNPHLSRPKVSGVIEDRKSGKSLSLPHAGESVLDWSVDSRRLLWTRYIIDPNNDGNCLWTEIWTTTVADNNSHKVDAGSTACFTPDGNHALYLRTEANEDATPRGLYVADLYNHRHRVLGNCDAAFTVWNSSRHVNIKRRPHVKTAKKGTVWKQ